MATLQMDIVNVWRRDAKGCVKDKNFGGKTYYVNSIEEAEKIAGRYSLLPDWMLSDAETGRIVGECHGGTDNIFIRRGE
jgi:hypothetical protein